MLLNRLHPVEQVGKDSGVTDDRESDLELWRSAPWRGWRDFWNSAPFPDEDGGWTPRVQVRYEEWRLMAATVKAAGLQPPRWRGGPPPLEVWQIVARAERAIGSPLPVSRRARCA